MRCRLFCFGNLMIRKPGKPLVPKVRHVRQIRPHSRAYFLLDQSRRRVALGTTGDAQGDSLDLSDRPLRRFDALPGG